MDEMRTQVESLIHKIRPYLQRDGGDIEIVNIEDVSSMLRCWVNVMVVSRLM